MADNVIDSLLIQIGLDGTELKQGLDEAAASLQRFMDNAEASGESVDRLAASATKSGLVLGEVSDEVAGRIMQIGTAGQKASLIAGRALSELGQSIGAVGATIMSLGAPLLAAFGGASIFNSFRQQGDSLAILSERLDISAQKIDAWAKANEDAGGSQEAFRSALENFVLTTGRGEKAFFEMGDHIKGLTRRQAEFFLQTQGLSADAAAVFLKYRDNAEQAAEAFKGVAMTDEQVKLSREFNRQWKWFTNQAQALGTILLTAVMPAVNGFMKTVSAGVQFLNEHSRFVKIMAGLIAAVFGGAYLKNIIAAIKSTSLFFGIFTKGVPVLQAFNAALLANPVGAMIAAVVALGLVLDDLIGFLQGDISGLGMFMEWLGLSETQIESIRQNVLSFGKALAGLPATVANAAKGIWGDLKKIGSKIAEVFRLPDIGDGLGKFFSGIGEAASAVGSVLWAGIVAGFTAIDDVVDAVSKIPDAFVKGFGNGIDYVSSLLKTGVFEPLSAFAGSLWDDMVAGANNAAKAVYEALMTPVAMVKKAIDGLFDMVGGLGGAFDKALSLFGFDSKDDKGDKATQTVKQIGKAVDDSKEPSVWPGIARSIGAALDNAFVTPMPALAGAPAGIAAQNAYRTTDGNSVNTDMKVTVQTNINTSADPQEVGNAVASGVNRAMSKAKDYIANAATGVVQKG